jgi:RNA polymerase sigma-70 factor (ECF subfamily)
MTDDDRQDRLMAQKALEEDFLAAYENYADAIFRHCAYRLGDREIGRELMQETFMKVWEYLRTDQKTIDNMQAFLYRTAHNLIIDHVRRKKKRIVDSLESLQETGFDLPDEHPGPSRRFTYTQIMETIEMVEEPYRTALVMRHIDGLPPREIADLLDVSPNVASVRINRGVKQLQALLDPSLETDENE